MDYDSDTMILFDNDKLLELAYKCKEYKVCVNKVPVKSNKQYFYNKQSMADIDNTLAKSQKLIGRIVNLGQFCMSVYYDELNNGTDPEDLKELWAVVDIMTILSGISIDLAKRQYDVNIEETIKEVLKMPELKRKKPEFFRYISQAVNIENNIEKYNTAMDYLKDSLKTPNADRKSNIELISLINKPVGEENRKQYQKIDNIVSSFDLKMKEIQIQYNNVSASKSDKAEKYNKMVDVVREHSNKINKLEITENTMYYCLYKMCKSGKYSMKLLNILYVNDKDKFINTFIRQASGDSMMVA
jgi:hypothetical protein